jgi:hypothetical protein
MAGLASWRWARGDGTVLLFDPSLEAGRRFAAAGRAAGGPVRALEGDPVRLAREVLAATPALVAGISRQADALLLHEAAMEAGYVRAAAVDGAHRCTTAECRPGWHALARMTTGAGDGWIEAFAAYAARPGHGGAPLAAPAYQAVDPGRVFGWVLARA